MNRAGNVHKSAFVKMSHDNYQSRRRKDKLTNPCIGKSFRYVEAAEYFLKCSKFEEVDENGVVVIPRRSELDSVMMNLGNGRNRNLGTLTKTVEGRSVKRWRANGRINLEDESESFRRAVGTDNHSFYDYREETVGGDENRKETFSRE